MNLRNRNKVKAEFSMASLTDIIFLLLIFFMLTSTLVSPNALKLLLPSSSSQTIAKQNIKISINKDLEYFIDTKKVSFEELPDLIRAKMVNEEDPTIVLNAEKSVPWDNIVQIMNLSKELNVKIIAATSPPKKQ